MFSIVFESCLDFSTAFLQVCCHALSKPSIKASAKQINNVIKCSTLFFRQAVGWHGQALPACLINRGENGGPWKQEGNLNLGSLLHLTHMPEVAVRQTSVKRNPPASLIRLAYSITDYNISKTSTAVINQCQKVFSYNFPVH